MENGQLFRTDDEMQLCGVWVRQPREVSQWSLAEAGNPKRVELVFRN